MKKIKGIKGITLIALVITIIVMLILVGVTINVVLNGNLIGNASKAREDQETEIQRELLQTAVWAAIDPETAKVDFEKLSLPECFDVIKKGKYKYTKEGSAINGRMFYVLEDGTVTLEDNNIDFEEIKEDVKLNYDKYLAEARTLGQSEEVEDIGIGTDGKVVNLSLWTYDYVGNSTFSSDVVIKVEPGIVLSGNNKESGYKGEIDVNGRIKGTVPQLIFLKSENDIYNVNRIGNYAFYRLSSLKEIKIPETIEWIENNSFANCSGLANVEIPSSVKYIGSGAFSSCSGLINIEIPNSVLYINSYAFYNCSKITSIKIPGSVYVINGQAFQYCSNLKTVEIENGVKFIGGLAFADCYNLTEIRIDNTEDAIPGAKWGAYNATVIWLRGNESSEE